MLIKAGWQDASLELRNLVVTTCTIFMASTAVTPSLVTQGFLTPCFTLKFLILQTNYFEFPCILACSYEFRAIKVLPHHPHLNLDIVEENLSKPGFRQINFNLPNSPTPSLINIRNRNTKYWSQVASSFL